MKISFCFLFFVFVNIGFLKAQLLHEVAGQGEFVTTTPLSTLPSQFDATGVLTGFYNADQEFGGSGVVGINNTGNFGIGVKGLGSQYGLIGEVWFPGDMGFYYGVYGNVRHGTGNSMATHYGVYGASTGGGGTTYAGYFAGDLQYTGTLNPPSDKKLKKGIKTLNNALEVILQLEAKSYEFRTEEFQKLNLPKGKHYGFIAQDFQKVLPELIRKNVHPTEKNDPPFTYLGINYSEMIPILTKATQEQQTIIENQAEEIRSLKAENTEIRQELADLKALVQQALNNQNTPTQTLQQTTTTLNTPATLKQNQPNPFNNNTTIQYSLPKGTNNGQLQITDQKGQVIKVVNLTGEGAGQVELKSGTLSAGSYFYSLIVDGQVVDTKQMVLTK